MRCRVSHILIIFQQQKICREEISLLDGAGENVTNKFYRTEQIYHWDEFELRTYDVFEISEIFLFILFKLKTNTHSEIPTSKFSKKPLSKKKKT